MYLKCDLKSLDLKQLDHKFDVILVEPPLEEYQRTMGVTNMEFWSWERVSSSNPLFFPYCQSLINLECSKMFHDALSHM